MIKPFVQYINKYVNFSHEVNNDEVIFSWEKVQCVSDFEVNTLTFLLTLTIFFVSFA